jgi:PBP4 family serine-type D-alanyl-D-alanine carboxypeptidase
VHRSAPLSVLGTTMMKLSQNLYAETLLKTLGAAAANAATVEAGRAVVQKTIASWDIPAADIQIVDGSGLSRYNLVTPGGLVATLAHAAHDERLRTPFEATLPVAGVDGTLERRMRGTTAQRNVRAKTGSFSNARTMAGYVRTADGEPLAFAILANNYGSPADVVEKTIDAIATSLAQFSR